MKVYLQGLLFSALLLCGYLFINIRVFELDQLQIVRHSLFHTFKPAFKLHRDIALYNTGTLTEAEIIEKVHALAAGHPYALGVITCDQKTYKTLTETFANNPRVFVAACDGQSGLQSARILQEGNTVTHFSGALNSFEDKLVGDRKLARRNSEIEMINFQPNAFFKHELRDLEVVDDLSGKILILGYLGDQMSRGDLYYFKNSRITPLNPYYGDDRIAPDTYDAEISAHIVATIHNEEFITEVPLWGRILIILGVCLVNACAIMFIKTRWLLANVAIYIFFLFLFIIGCSGTMVYLFSNDIYLNLDGLEVLLLIVSVFTVFSTEGSTRELMQKAG